MTTSSVADKEQQVKVYLSEIEANTETGLHEMISRLIDEGYTVSFTPDASFLATTDERWYPVRIEVSFEGKVIAEAIGMILDEVLRDVHSNTPGRGNRESEAA